MYHTPVPRDDEPRYVIHVAARLVGLHPRTLRHYEQIGLLERHDAEQSGYSEADLEQVRLIRRLVADLGVNLAGAQVILHMRQQLLDLHREMEHLRRQLASDLS